MVKKRRAFKSMLALTAIALLLGQVGCEMIEPRSGSPVPTAARSSQVSPLLATAVPPSPVSPLATPTRPSPVPTDDDIAPTPAPTTTPPPLPTPLPTPVVTPIPTAVPPIIPEVVGKAQQPFWIIYWQGNEVWRIDNQGKERQLLLDTYKSLGQWLTDVPDPFKGSDCCWIGPRVVVSPDGQKLALVVVDKIKGTKSDRFTFSIYVFDIKTNNLRLLSKGLQPVWSPDSRRIAFLREEYDGLWIANLETRQMDERVAKHENPQMHITEFTWSADSTQLAYMYNYGTYQRVPTVWLVRADDQTLPRQLLSLDVSIFIGGLAWSPNGQLVFYLSPEGARDRRYESVQNLWAVSLTTGVRTQLTRDIGIQSYGISPEKKWMFIAGYPLYEWGKKNYDRDVWLLSIDGKDLRRVTANQGDLAIAGWSPDGTHLIVWRAEARPLLYSLADRTAAVLDLDLDSNYEVGGPK